MQVHRCARQIDAKAQMCIRSRDCRHNWHRRNMMMFSGLLSMPVEPHFSFRCIESRRRTSASKWIWISGELMKGQTEMTQDPDTRNEKFNLICLRRPDRGVSVECESSRLTQQKRNFICEEVDFSSRLIHLNFNCELISSRIQWMNLINAIEGCAQCRLQNGDWYKCFRRDNLTACFVCNALIHAPCNWQIGIVYYEKMRKWAGKWILFIFIFRCRIRNLWNRLPNDLGVVPGPNRR